ncbi:MAG: helix-turn-helix domain-containing protein [Sphingobacterium sp.]|jgi:transcriptional regulator with XRE-family HTH domain|uniref:helix-turn-helix domain-containing protein n=1 Tax=Sphingobacterium sp. TaxID=341027 RepID=UPI00283DC399|nr:helix-turn-helix transcriptional regulator [Sphingobacterium sp.]MDR3008610.1 helix-turn-helix domain-containing protein [Sphingobacterium sp.]
MDINKLTASNIKELRSKSGLTIEAVAADLKISKSAYSQMENGKTELTLTKIQAIAQIFNVSFGDIIPSASKTTHTYNGNGGLNGNNISAHVQNNFFANNEETLKAMYESLKDTFDSK